jgi:hypothetical protein
MMDGPGRSRRPRRGGGSLPPGFAALIPGDGRHESRTVITRLRRSTVFKLRLALVDERAHAFLLIVEREGRMKLAPLEEQPFRK